MEGEIDGDFSHFLAYHKQMKHTNNSILNRTFQSLVMKIGGRGHKNSKVQMIRYIIY